MTDILLLVAAACLLGLAYGHSTLGERRLIGPVLAAREGVLRSDYARLIVRFAWHLTSVLFLVLASLLATLALRPAALAPALLIAVGLALTGTGIWDGVATRGRHIGWWLLTGGGLAALAAFAIRR